MHYLNGIEPKVGDQIVSRGANGAAITGVVVALNRDAKSVVIADARPIDSLPADSCIRIDDALTQPPAGEAATEHYVLSGGDLKRVDPPQGEGAAADPKPPPAKAQAKARKPKK